MSEKSSTIHAWSETTYVYDERAFDFTRNDFDLRRNNFVTEWPETDTYIGPEESLLESGQFLFYVRQTLKFPPYFF